jgi:DNA-binding MarR family transcriptional regulator
MDDPPDRETAEVLLALVASPGGRATPKDVAERLDRPLGVVSRQLRDAQRAGWVGSAITLTDEPGRDRMYWLTADKGLQALFDAGAAIPDADEPLDDE